ncbi:MAG: 16S rRNA (cytidine(1402)-2'-O)-methyltransferase [Leptospiraceae bacterium]|nr:16S rRNA (cytidine(1402)-2'-O)-methyltransferase [Leptospiraceae bacterium]
MVPLLDKTLPPGLALYVVPTPIGNLEDMTLRGIRVLSQVDLILSEDTRKTGLLLKQYDITTRQKSFRIHMHEQDEAFAIQRLNEGLNLAFCSDAGTPGISDPVATLIRRLRLELPMVPIYPLPGASALGAALSVCGFQTNPALFAGFLSTKSGRRTKYLQSITEFEGITVFYESVHRIEKLLGEIRAIHPGRDIFIAREISKIHEEYLLIPGGLSDADWTARMAQMTQKGEFTVILGPPTK